MKEGTKAGGSWNEGGREGTKSLVFANAGGCAPPTPLLEKGKKQETKKEETRAATEDKGGGRISDATFHCAQRLPAKDREAEV